MMNGSIFHAARSGASLLLIALIAGCDKNSADLSTKDIDGDFSVELDNSDPTKPQTTFEVVLRESEAESIGPQGSVNLTGGDGLNVTTDKNDNLPIPRTDDGKYDASLPNINAAVFTFHLKRSTASSDGTVFTMQAPIAFTSPTPGQTFAVGDTVHFIWSNKTPNTSSSVSGKVFVSGEAFPCGGVAVTLASKQNLPFDDNGFADIPLAQLYDAGSPKSGDCVNISVRREVVTGADPAFDSASTVTGKRTDRFQIKVQ